MEHGFMVNTEGAETSAVSRGTSRVTIKQHAPYVNTPLR